MNLLQMMKPKKEWTDRRKLGQKGKDSKAEDLGDLTVVCHGYGNYEITVGAKSEKGEELNVDDKSEEGKEHKPYVNEAFENDFHTSGENMAKNGTLLDGKLEEGISRF